MQRLTTLLFASVLAFGLVFAVGCDSSGSSTEDGTMDVQLMDGSSTTTAITTKEATTPKSHVTDTLNSALVTVSKISAIPASDGETDSEAEPVVLSEESADFDLIDLATGNTDRINNLQIPAGDYGQLRLSTGDVALEFKDETTKTGMIASNRVVLDFSESFTVNSADDKVDVTVDWNVVNSLEGNLRGQLVITPVVNATATVTTVDEEGSN